MSLNDFLKSENEKRASAERSLLDKEQQRIAEENENRTVASSVFSTVIKPSIAKLVKVFTDNKYKAEETQALYKIGYGGSFQHSLSIEYDNLTIQFDFLNSNSNRLLYCKVYVEKLRERQRHLLQQTASVTHEYPLESVTYDVLENFVHQVLNTDRAQLLKV